MSSNKKIIIGVLVALVVVLFGIVMYSLGLNNKEDANTQQKVSTQIKQNTSVQNKDYDLVYVNKKYNFQITFPESWRGYVVDENPTYGNGRSVTFSFPQQDNLFTVEVYTKNEWSEEEQAYKSGKIPTIGKVLGESGQYVYIEPFAFEVLPGVEKQANDLDKVRSGFTVVR